MRYPYQFLMYDFSLPDVKGEGLTKKREKKVNNVQQISAITDDEKKRKYKSYLEIWDLGRFISRASSLRSSSMRYCVLVNKFLPFL